MFIYALHACNKCTLFLPIKYVVKIRENKITSAYWQGNFIRTRDAEDPTKW